jgi:uncharacterized protein
MITTSRPPLIRRLDREECERTLPRNLVGRIAYASANHVDIEPVHDVFAPGWLYGRTSRGRKSEMLGPSWWPVSFEVNEIDGLFRWRSVVVHGGIDPLQPDGSTAEAEIWSSAVGVFRTLLPDALSERDAVANRTLDFRIAVQEISGRETEPGPAKLS